MDPTEQPRLADDRPGGPALLRRPGEGGWRAVSVVVDGGALHVTGDDAGPGPLDVPLSAVNAVDAIGEPVDGRTEVEVVLDRFPPLHLRLDDEPLDALLSALVASVGSDPSAPAAVGVPATTRSGRRALTAPRVWAGALVLCVLVSVAAFLGASLARRAGAAPSTADALATVGAVYLGATACAFVGLAFGAARASEADRRPADGARSALVASAVLVLVALLTAGIIVSERIEPDLGVRSPPTEIRDTDVTTDAGGSTPDGGACPTAAPAPDC
ncbi:hypothetical protein [Dermatobacter hominis]|uniref:hypothetical protein n=1 Tax=Dermatobacter hominis TaxID=2884263 RepID=UPI001D106A97|nr:hypothetical protein [Dermatobacter hominis]UDY36168.1 hypothetical protein LH044_01200 [Dermatobacter hominis]